MCTNQPKSTMHTDSYADDLIVGNMGNELSFPVYSAFEFLLQLAVGVYAVVKLILLFNERLDALQPLQEVYVTTLDLMLLSPPIVLFLMRYL